MTTAWLLVIMLNNSMVTTTATYPPFADKESCDKMVNTIRSMSLGDTKQRMACVEVNIIK